MNPSVTVVTTAKLSYQGREVYADIRTSEQVDTGSIIIDSRIFDELVCEAHCEIILTAFPEEIPNCNEISLLVDFLDRVENAKDLDTVSNRIEDLKDYLDGLILKVGQRIEIIDLGLRLVVDDIKPFDPNLQVSRVMWKRLLKVNLNALDDLPSCFNICFAIDVGASSMIDDVGINDASLGITRLEVGLNVVGAFLSSSRECSDALVAAVAFADSSYKMEIGEGRLLELNPESYQQIHDWISARNDDHSDEPSNPGEALEFSLDLASELKAQNGLPTLILLISGGAFTSGRNPVSMARAIATNNGVLVSCVSLGIKSDLDLMGAIADAGNGRLIHIGHFKDVASVIKGFIDRFRSEEVRN